MVARSWRELTGGTERDRDDQRRTLVAVSGGGDSVGLLRALVSGVGRAQDLFVVGHVVHDMRDRASALEDQEWVRELARSLGLSFCCGEIKAREAGGNYEAAARRLRYAELARMAKAARCGYVATAHHADDQLETVLMALMRGAGPRGLGGVAPKRGMDGVTVIRPALLVTRADLQQVSLAIHEFWREDATNTDQSRLRAAIRARVVPELERLRPGAAERASRAARVSRGAARVVSDSARAVISTTEVGGGLSWTRVALRDVPAVVLGEVIRCGARRLMGGRGADRMGATTLERVVVAIKDRGTEPRRFVVGKVEVEVTARRVSIITREESNG